MATSKALVIVESPTKAKTIEKYLGDGFTVRSSMGHLIDLPKSRIAVDVENDFRPDYITIRGKGKLLNELKREAARSDKIYLAADSDREGEAISFHIMNAMRKARPEVDIKRVVFNEITARAIRKSIAEPRDIDMSLVNAQKARRILDRLVGYSLSPLLWEKIKKGLSAGRVQSVVLRVICEREKTIEDFNSVEFWTIDADFRKDRKTFSARLVQYDGKKADIGSEEEADKILEHVRGRDFIVHEVEEKERRRKSTAPFTTSKMQQTAGSRFGFQARKTMMIAQQLYEGINLEEGPVGLITYMRTDSTRVADEALQEVRGFIGEQYTEKYLPEKPNVFKKKGGTQDAHEAIRPTSVYRTPELMKSFLSRDQYRLYTLIWEQFVASQMREAVFKQIRADIKAGKALFRATGSKVLFNGFMKVLKNGKNGNAKPLPPLSAGEKIDPEKIEKEVHFTEPPPRFTDATIVKFLEESGIGRPSTYAPIISTLISRYYVVRNKRQFVPTFLGRLVNDLLVQYFSDLLQVEFTSNMEGRLDAVAENKLNWVHLLRDFYEPFRNSVEDARERLVSYKGITDVETDYVCDKCGRKMVKKLGKYGFFLACSGFPECRNTLSFPYGKCPREGCDGFIIERKTKKRRTFYGCSHYPDCDFMIWDKPLEEPCPSCGSILVLKEKDGVRHKVCLRESCGYEAPVDEEKKDGVLV